MDLGCGKRSIWMEVGTAVTDAVPGAAVTGKCDWVREMDCEWTCMRRVVGQNLEKERIGWRRRRRRDSWTRKRKDSEHPLAAVEVVLSW